jgi:DNA-3-methyladenine glycosylase
VSNEGRERLAALFERPTLEVAPALLGLLLVRTGPAGQPSRTGRIVEVEAYLGPADQASHARFGETARSRPMYGRAGTAYVYLVYGMYRCLNVVTAPTGTPHAVLIRAVEPLGGIEQMRQARLAAERRAHRSWSAQDDARASLRIGEVPAERLARGPGLVGAAFDVELAMTGSDLLDPGAALHLEAGSPDEPAGSIAASTRVGIAFAGRPWTEQPWRFSLAGHPSVSG